MKRLLRELVGRPVNVALIPYVALRFPRESRAYARRCFQ